MYKLESWEERIETVRAIKYHLFKGHRHAPCMWCGTLLEFEAATIEHLTPKSHGGDYSVENAGVACQTCNQKRGTQSIEQFMGSQWLQMKRHQIQAAKSNRKIPRHPDGTEMDDSEIRLDAQRYLADLEVDALVAIVMGLSKPSQIDRWAQERITDQEAIGMAAAVRPAYRKVLTQEEIQTLKDGIKEMKND